MDLDLLDYDDPSSLSPSFFDKPRSRLENMKWSSIAVGMVLVVAEVTAKSTTAPPTTVPPTPKPTPPPTKDIQLNTDIMPTWDDLGTKPKTKKIKLKRVYKYWAALEKRDKKAINTLYTSWTDQWAASSKVDDFYDGAKKCLRKQKETVRKTHAEIDQGLAEIAQCIKSEVTPPVFTVLASQNLPDDYNSVDKPDYGDDDKADDDEDKMATTTAPTTTTVSPVVTTATPVMTTAAPVVTTAAPMVMTTFAPVTATPQVTTVAPVMTTAAPTTTTAAVEEPMMPGVETTRSNDQAVMPGTETTTNNDQGTMLSTATQDQTTVADDQPMMPGTEATTSNDALVMPGTDATAVQDQPSMSGTDATVSQDQLSMPGTDATVSNDQLSMPGTDVTVSNDQATMPGADVTASNDEPTTSDNDGTIPDQPLMPGTDATVSDEQPQMPGMGATPVNDEPTVPEAGTQAVNEEPTTTSDDLTTNDVPTMHGTEMTETTSVSDVVGSAQSSENSQLISPYTITESPTDIVGTDLTPESPQAQTTSTISNDEPSVDVNTAYVAELTKAEDAKVPEVVTSPPDAIQTVSSDDLVAPASVTSDSFDAPLEEAAPPVIDVPPVVIASPAWPFSPASPDVPPLWALDLDHSKSVAGDEWAEYVLRLRGLAMESASRGHDPMGVKLLKQIIDFHYDTLGHCIADKLTGDGVAELHEATYDHAVQWIETNCYVKFRYSLFAGVPPFEWIAKDELTVHVSDLEEWFSHKVATARNDLQVKQIVSLSPEHQAFVDKFIGCTYAKLERTGDVAVDRTEYYNTIRQIAACSEQ